MRFLLVFFCFFLIAACQDNPAPDSDYEDDFLLVAHQTMTPLDGDYSQDMNLKALVRNRIADGPDDGHWIRIARWPSGMPEALRLHSTVALPEQNARVAQRLLLISQSHYPYPVRDWALAAPLQQQTSFHLTGLADDEPITVNGQASIWVPGEAATVGQGDILPEGTRVLEWDERRVDLYLENEGRLTARWTPTASRWTSRWCTAHPSRATPPSTPLSNA